MTTFFYYLMFPFKIKVRNQEICKGMEKTQTP